MKLDQVRGFLSKLSAHDLPVGVAALVGIVLLILVFKTAKFLMKLLLLLIALGLLTGASWWHLLQG
jgi:hypothetical protein